MGGFLLLSVLAAGIPVGFFNPTPLDDLTVNLNLNQSPNGYEEDEADITDASVPSGEDDATLKVVDRELCVAADCTHPTAKKFCPIKCAPGSNGAITPTKYLLSPNAPKVRVNFTDSCSPNKEEKILDGTLGSTAFVTNGTAPECLLAEISAWPVNHPSNKCTLVCKCRYEPPGCDQ